MSTKEQLYLRQHNVVQLFDEMTGALLSSKPKNPNQFLIDWLKRKVRSELRINTSNPNKFKEFQRIFASHGISLKSTTFDLPEIEADAHQVIAHKATQCGDGVICEDTSLDIEGGCVGINVRWLMDELSDYAGRKATWRVLLGLKVGDVVEIYEGVVYGIIVFPRGDSNFGFDPVFQPVGSDKTLAEF